MDIKDKTSSITTKFTAVVFRSFSRQLALLSVFCAVPLLVVIGEKEAHFLIKARFEAQGSNHHPIYQAYLR